MQTNKPMSFSSSDHDRDCSNPDECIDQSVDMISFEFNRHLELDRDDDSSSQQLLPDPEVHADDQDHDCEDEEEDDDGDFTFMHIGDNDSPVSADKVFEDGQIRTAFPLFDQNLLLGGEYEVEEIDRLPVRPPVDKVFIESPRRSPPSTASEHEENDDVATGPYCVWTKESATGTAELSKKSNSTGFSKLWRIRDKVNRSNSDGRDAFVFLKSSDRTTTTTTTTRRTTTTPSSSSSANPTAAAGSFVKANAAGGKARVVKKTNKPTVSAHEAYLRSRGGHAEEERRRSYLPYRPELMGFFTNVNGGLTKNVHPY